MLVWNHQIYMPKWHNYIDLYPKIIHLIGNCCPNAVTIIYLQSFKLCLYGASQPYHMHRILFIVSLLRNLVCPLVSLKGLISRSSHNKMAACLWSYLYIKGDFKTLQVLHDKIHHFQTLLIKQAGKWGSAACTHWKCT